MKTSNTLRATSAAASVLTTFLLFNAVASLAEPPQPVGTSVQVAQAQRTPAR